jgi:outer membrane protein
LNRPNSLDNFRSALTTQQTLFDAGQTKNAIRAGQALQKIAASDVQRTESEVTFNTVRAYLDTVLSDAALSAAAESVISAEADLERAQNIHQAGMSTEADVLSIRVHLAHMKEQQIRRSADLASARAALNDALGLPLDTAHELTSALTRSALPPPNTLQVFERGAAEKRPEQLRLQYTEQLATAQLDRQRSTLWPTVNVEAVLEADRQTFVTRGGANCTVAASLNWNLFNGLRDKAQIEEARQQLIAAKAGHERMSSAVRLEVRRAWEELQASNQRITVSEATDVQAAESLRVTQNRYQAGLSTVTELLRTESAVLESRTEYLSALHDQRLAAAQLDAAAGALTLDSLSLKD